MDNHYLKVKDPLILKENITNLSTPINKIFNLTLLCGSVAFLITGAQSYFTPLLNENSNSTYIVFYPQGLTMSIYGIIGTILSISQILYEYNKIGEGYNEFNKRTGEIKIFRKRNLNSNVYLNYRIDDIESIKINKNNNLGIREESISLCLKNKVELPIIQRYHLTADEDIERKASNLAYFLNIPIKGNEV